MLLPLKSIHFVIELLLLIPTFDVPFIFLPSNQSFKFDSIESSPDTLFIRASTIVDKSIFILLLASSGNDPNTISSTSV